MKALSTIFLLALIPTFLFSTNPGGGDLYGLWFDHYTDTKLEIKHSRNGIKVKEHHGWFRKWRTYNYMGRGLYDDCDGRIIVVLGNHQIEWRKGRRGRPLLLTRYRDYGYRDYREYDRRTGYYDQRSYNRGNTNPGGRSGRFGRERYSGDWYCSDRGFSLTIQLSGGGFQARSRGKTSYYEPYGDHYRDNRGNRYYLSDSGLTWQSFDGQNRLRFGRR